MNPTPAFQNVHKLRLEDRNPFESKLFLIIDSVPEMQRAMSMTLSSVGANKVEYATRATEAMTKLSRFDVDVVMCDYDLGNGYDGLHLLEEIKERNLIKQSCVFMIVTSERRAHRVIGAAELAPDAYLLKPFTGEQLLQRLERAVKRKDVMKGVDNFIMHHEYLSAIAECDKRISNKDEYIVDFLRLKGSLAIKIGDHLAAKTVYEQIMAIKPLGWAKMGLAKALTLNKQFDEARVHFEEILDENDHIMEAYDWLSKIQTAQGALANAQETVQKAVTLSPVVLKRQKALGEAATLNGDFGVAAEALQKTIDIAKYSAYRCVEDYANLARVQRLKGDLNAATQTAMQVRREFKGDPVASWVATLMDSQVQSDIGQQIRARELLDQAIMQFKDFGALLTQDAQLELAHACYQQGRDEVGKQVMETLVRNNHDNEAVLKKIANVFALENREDIGQSLINENVQSVVDLNNNGVRLAQAGRLDDAVGIFMKAVEELPNNQQVTLNAVNAILGYIHKKGWHESYIAQAQGYLEKVRRMDPTSVKYQKLLQAYRAIVQKNGKNEWML